MSIEVESPIAPHESDLPPLPDSFPRVSVWGAVKRHPVLAIAPVVILVIVAVALGMKRSAQYTAETDLSVGHAYVGDAAGIPGVIEATQSLAAVDARAVGSDAVQSAAAQVLQSRHQRASGSLDATPIPNTPLIKVTATSSSANGAVQLSNAGAQALQDYVNGQSQAISNPQTALRLYRQASVAYQQALDASNQAKATYNRSPSDSNKSAADQAAATADAAQVRRDGLRATYNNLELGVASSPLIETFASAQSSSSDRASRIELMAFIALLAGVAIGIALAVLRAQREVARRWLAFPTAG